jgi:hypothetical protein
LAVGFAPGGAPGAEMSNEPTGSEARSAAESELQASSELFLNEVERLATLEREKQQMAPGAEREAKAREIEDVALDLVSRSRYQTRLVEMQAQSMDEAEAAPRPAGVIIEEWRAAERRLNDARSALERATDEADRLRDEHRRSARQRRG